MSVAYYIVLDNEDPGFDTYVDGGAIAHEADELDALCDEAGVERLETFNGQSMDELSEMLDEDIELPEGEDPDAVWFEPQEGIEWIDKLIEAIHDNPDALQAPEDVIADLNDYKSVLTQALAVGARWHLALDI